ncbi:Stk1 family PASTA domain-containing Ser/Thr kinase [Diplocloster agilis]|uniref:Stk1 family PASTA domain-containing Ser/Thr kinase n=1 Tax=Diplocloster agilis TaxID=2850323 RepID=UPI00082075DD|nr:Stk1 family PASTA domain-containing Ser/Thr kinase [Suonthocola fibrivorans]MCU6734096.1 Stk1 family PASTA domain-containing Ser/Thr kinase [Suonthocola fibrivorans]SCJ23663.1 Serine/threonine-protein kinase PrkC [uncultured Clostridium sp.]
MLTTGMFVGGRYEIIEKIGTGGMADVYKGKDRKLNRYVAIKVLKNEFRGDTTFVAKFKAEAQAAAGLAHPNIVNVYDVGDEDGVYYIVMELVDGITLKEYIERKGRLSSKEAISIAIQVSMGLEAAHNNHIIHRDIKPQNIIISTDGKVKVTDFGIAKAASSQTISSSAMGSVHYTSPEQARGGYSDEKSDIYSLGVTMYEMVTGRVPFDGDTPVVIAVKHLQEEMISPKYFAPELPYSLEQIIIKMTQKSPDRRYNNMSEVIQDLKQALVSPEGDFVKASPIDQTAKTVMFTRDDVKQIKRETGRIHVQPEQRYEDEEYDDGEYEDDEYEYEDEDYEDSDEDDEDDDDKEVNPKLEKIMTIGGIVAAVIIALIVLFLVGKMVGIFSFGSNKDKDKENKEPQTTASAETDQVEMPKLVGMQEEKAQAKLKEMELGYKTTYKESNDYEEGEVMEQSVKSGDMVKKHTTIELTVCSGESYVQLIDVSGLSEDKAKQKLEDEGFKVTIEESYSDDVDKGNVISTDPKAGSDVKPNQTIRMTVSKGKEIREVVMPNFTNMTMEQVDTLITQNKLKWGTVTEQYNSSVEEGRVINQSPSQGTTVTERTEVNVTVSKGPEPTPTPTPNQEWASVRVQLNDDVGAYTGGPARMVVEQSLSDGSKRTVDVFSNQTFGIPFSYVLEPVKGASGISSGKAYLYETDPATGEEKKVGQWTITFQPSN